MFTASIRLRFLIALLLLAPLSSCSEDGTTGPETPGEYVWVHLEGDSSKIRLDELPPIDVDAQAAVHLDELVDTSLVPMYLDKSEVLHDARVLYAYRIVGEDGFSASVKGYPDNIWEHMPLGYILTATRNVVFPDEAIDLAGAYNVKATRHVYILRKFDVVAPDTSAFYELVDMPVTQIENFEAQMEDAVSLADFVSALVPDPAARSYYITALDGFGNTDPLSWTQMQTGYWLLETEKTKFTDPALDSSRYKLKVLERIEVE
jgi:hypothetical protein